MPTNFERVRMMLDQMGPNLTNASQAGARTTLARLSDDYRQLGNDGLPPIDYSAAETHMAYVYGYLVSNSSLMFQALRGCHAEARAKFDRPVVNIVAIGGGPASELIGIFKFIESTAIQQVHINLTVVDREANWAAVWPIAASTAPEGVTVDINFAAFSLHEGQTPAPPVALLGADIVTFSFCLSESWRYNQFGVVTQRLRSIVDIVPPTAIVLYADNGGPTFDFPADRDLLTRADVRPLFRERLSNFIGPDEEKNVLAAYKEWYGRWARWTGDATIAAVEKI